MFLAPSILNKNLYTPEFGFLNAYVQDHTHEVLYDNHIYFLFDPPKFTLKFRQYIDKIRETDLYEEDYDVSPEYLGKVMVVMKFNPEYNQIKENVLKGKFSDLSPEYMEKYIPKSDYNGTLSLPFRIYTKHPSLREQLEQRLGTSLSPTAELWSIPDLAEEIYNYNPGIKYKI